MPPPSPEPEPEPKPEPAPVTRRKRVEILNALMFRVSADGFCQFVWPHSENVEHYRRRGFVLLIDAATIDPDEARSAEIQIIREQEQEMWNRRGFEEWARSFKPFRPKDGEQ